MNFIIYNSANLPSSSSNLRNSRVQSPSKTLSKSNTSPLTCKELILALNICAGGCFTLLAISTSKKNNEIPWFELHVNNFVFN